MVVAESHQVIAGLTYVQTSKSLRLSLTCPPIAPNWRSRKTRFFKSTGVSHTDLRTSPPQHRETTNFHPISLSVRTGLESYLPQGHALTKNPVFLSPKYLPPHQIPPYLFLRNPTFPQRMQPLEGCRAIVAPQWTGSPLMGLRWRLMRMRPRTFDPLCGSATVHLITIENATSAIVTRTGQATVLGIAIANGNESATVTVIRIGLPAVTGTVAAVAATMEAREEAVVVVEAAAGEVDGQMATITTTVAAPTTTTGMARTGRWRSVWDCNRTFSTEMASLYCGRHAQAASAFRSNIRYDALSETMQCLYQYRSNPSVFVSPPQLYSYCHVRALVMLCGTGTDILSYCLLYLSYPSTCSCTWRLTYLTDEGPSRPIFALLRPLSLYLLVSEAHSSTYYRYISQD